MKNVLSVCMISALMGLCSCASTKNAVDSDSINGEWNIIEINGTVVVPTPGRSFPYISFNTKTRMMYGNSGCNNIIGTFDARAKPGRISLHTLGGARMTCPDITLENSVLTALDKVNKYRKTDADNILLYGSSRYPVVVLQKKPRKPLPPVPALRKLQ